MPELEEVLKLAQFCKKKSISFKARHQIPLAFLRPLTASTLVALTVTLMRDLVFDDSVCYASVNTWWPSLSQGAFLEGVTVNLQHIKSLPPRPAVVLQIVIRHLLRFSAGLET